MASRTAGIKGRSTDTSFFGASITTTASPLRSARGTHSSSNTRIDNQMGFGLFKRSNGYFPGNGREIVEEFLRRMSALNVIDQRLKRNACSNKNGSTAENIRIGVNDRG